MNMEISKITTIDKENQIIFPYQPPKKRWGFPKVFFFPPPSSRRPPWTLRYPSRYEQVLSALCESMEALDEPEAKASMIWILGEYVSRHIWGSPYMDPRIRCLERNLGYTFGGVKYLLKRYLDTKNMNNASIFLRLEPKRWPCAICFQLGWIHHVWLSLKANDHAVLFLPLLWLLLLLWGSWNTFFQFIECTVYYTYIHSDIQFMVNLMFMPWQITDSATNHLQTFGPASSLQRKGFTVVVDLQSSPHVGTMIY